MACHIVEHGGKLGLSMVSKLTSAEETPPPNATGLAGLLGSVISVGRGILAPPSSSGRGPIGRFDSQMQLLHHRGEASGLALACEVIADYEALDVANQTLFFEALSDAFGPDREGIIVAADAYKANPATEQLTALGKAVEAPRVKLFRRMNMAPNATSVLVKMRGNLLQLLPEHPDFKRVDTDLKHQFVSWFNRGFLELRAIDWNSPAAVLERIIHYESVHAIQGWDDLRSRLRENRLCFAFFHLAMPDDPLVFVEVALTSGIPTAIAPLIERRRARRRKRSRHRRVLLNQQLPPGAGRRLFR